MRGVQLGEYLMEIICSFCMIMHFLCIFLFPHNRYTLHIGG